MEPVFKLSPGHRISIQSKTLFVKDLTGKVGDMEYTQDYDNPEVFTGKLNETGYTDENPRSNYALWLFAFIKTTKGDTPVDVRAADPLTVETFEVVYARDGWYEFRLIAVPVYPPTPVEPVIEEPPTEEPILLGDVTPPEGEEPPVEEPPVEEPPLVEPVYGNEGDVFYTLDKGLVMVQLGTYVPILPVTLLGTMYERTKSDKPVLLDAVTYKTQLNEKKEELIFQGKTKGVEYQSVKNDYDIVRALIESAYYQFLLGNKYVFQKIAEHLDANNACS